MVDREKLPPLSEAQLEILNVVWDCGEVTVGEVWRTLAERRDVARNTVLTMMVRLKDKGWLQHTSQAMPSSTVPPCRARLHRSGWSVV